MLSNRVRRLDAPLGGGRLREQPLLEHAPGDRDHAVVLADLDTELHRLPVGIPAGVLGDEVWETPFVGLCCLVVRSHKNMHPGGAVR